MNIYFNQFRKHDIPMIRFTESGTSIIRLQLNEFIGLHKLCQRISRLRCIVFYYMLRLRQLLFQ